MLRDQERLSKEMKIKGALMINLTGKREAKCILGKGNNPFE